MSVCLHEYDILPLWPLLCYYISAQSWWRHQMETFSASLAICVGNSPVHGEFPAQRPVTRSFYVFFDLRLNKRLRIQLWGWWFETLSCPLWRHHKTICPTTHIFRYRCSWPYKNRDVNEWHCRRHHESIPLWSEEVFISAFLVDM